ncbi:MAG TPA: class I SAM-dependent methyltransferase [Aggregatilineales bacterium]|nr:class I SAM-dependent methyltransferase [Anaerolineales bacterium]HRE46320.1 class I SAM-dependent methyltransferase [Aggregatilineales bacterium]
MTGTDTISAAFYDRIARYYDAENEFMTDDLPFYAALAEENGDPILDVGCGTGRVMLHLAGLGYTAHGVDVSVEMLRRGERRAIARADLRDKCRFFTGDAAAHPYPTRYPLILVPYNGFMHFRTLDGQIQALKHWRDHLTEDGVIAFDLPNAGEVFAGGDDDTLTFERSFTEPESGGMVMQFSLSRIDRTAQIQHISWVYDETAADGVLRRTVAPLTLRYVFPAEFDLLLNASGLAIQARYGDYEGGAFEDGSQRMIVLAGRR